MKIALIGGVPPTLGGGGLERQMRNTCEALQSIGHDAHVVWDGHASRGDLDIVHVFGADPATWNFLRHWTTKRCPLVVSPILVFDSKFGERMDRILSRVRLGPSTTATMRLDILKQADHLLPLTEYEAASLNVRYGIPWTKMTILPNGSDAKREQRTVSSRPPENEGYVVCAGTINDRKDQLGLLKMWRSEWPDLVFAGGVAQEWDKLDEFQNLLAVASNVRWLGLVDQSTLWALQGSALATISNSKSEGESLAILDSLKLGVGCLVRRSFSSASVALTYGKGICQYGNFDELNAILTQELASNGEFQSPEVDHTPPSWYEVANGLSACYGGLIESVIDRS